MNPNAEIRAELARQRMTYADLAQKLGTSRQNISRKLTSNRPISSTDLFEIAHALNITASEIIRRAEQALDTTPPNPTNNPPALADSGRVVSFVLDGREIHISETKAEQVFEHMQVCQVCNGFEQAFAHVRDFQEGL